jgi:molybdenum cofactor biosynthesis enzyme MoaA
MKLEDIGFYTLSDSRAEHASGSSPMWRCELILTDRCNFNCPYCMPMRMEARGDIGDDEALRVLGLWCDDGLKNVRFSGGEPTLHPSLAKYVEYARFRGIERIALSTNGSAPIDLYARLLDAGVNDFSVSLDACCASTAKVMSGGLDVLGDVERSIRFLALRAYVTAGVVLTTRTAGSVNDIVKHARDLGCADVRVISAAQQNFNVEGLGELDGMPILRYRSKRSADGTPMRGLKKSDSHRCRLVLDDSMVARGKHYPCVIYFRQGGEPIGDVGPNMRSERCAWSLSHDTWGDPICRGNCLDVCTDYNRKAEQCRS